MAHHDPRMVAMELRTIRGYLFGHNTQKFVFFGLFVLNVEQQHLLLNLNQAQMTGYMVCKNYLGPLLI